MNEELQIQINLIKQEIEEIYFILFKKSGAGSADIRTKLRSGSSIVINPGDIDASNMFATSVVDQNAIGDNSVDQAAMRDASVGLAEVKYEVVSVTVLAAATSGTATVTSGAIVLGYYPAGNQDQLVDNISISTTTLTITLAAAATADNTFKVVLLKP